MYSEKNNLLPVDRPEARNGLQTLKSLISSIEANVILSEVQYYKK